MLLLIYRQWAMGARLERLEEFPFRSSRNASSVAGPFVPNLTGYSGCLGEKEGRLSGLRKGTKDPVNHCEELCRLMCRRITWGAYFKLGIFFWSLPASIPQPFLVSSAKS